MAIVGKGVGLRITVIVAPSHLKGCLGSRKRTAHIQPPLERMLWLCDTTSLDIQFGTFVESASLFKVGDTDLSRTSSRIIRYRTALAIGITL